MGRYLAPSRGTSLQAEAAVFYPDKRDSGQGAFPAWVISHAELLRYQKERLIRSRG
jgi:hypothetical protein